MDVLSLDVLDINSITKRKQKMKHFFRVLLFIAIAALCSGCGSRNGRGSAASGQGDSGQEGGGKTGQNVSTAETTWQYVDTAMGTVIQQTLYAPDEETARVFSLQAMELLWGLERERLSWRLDTSEVYRANATSGSGEGFLLSRDLAELLESGMELSERSQGAFDMTLGSVTRLWNIDEWAAESNPEGFQIPSRETLAQALSACGYEKLRLEWEERDEGEREEGRGEEEQEENEREKCRIFLPEGMQLDLGAVGKGLGMSELTSLLEGQSSITGAVISLGGSILTYGSKPDGSSWRVGITDPFDKSSNIGILSLEGQWCISTSGDYERYVEVDGVRYHHILDPRTGAPAVSQVRGVTVVLKDGLLSDGLSTACFILGPQEGMALAAEYGAESLFILSNGEIVMSEGMERFFCN